MDCARNTPETEPTQGEGGKPVSAGRENPRHEVSPVVMDHEPGSDDT